MTNYLREQYVNVAKYSSVELSDAASARLSEYST